MKTIVVTTDFSPNANQAAHFAMQLAKAQRATLILVNAFHFWPTNPAEVGGDFPLSDQTMRDNSQHQLRALATELHKLYGNDVSIKCITKEGFAIPSIREVAQHEKADLVVMSITGSAPQGAQLMGSLATEMITETPVPLLLLPASTTYADITNVVLGIDLDTPPDAVVLDTALRFARLFKCTVDVLCIQDEPTNETTKQKAEHIRHLMGDVPHTLTIQPGHAVYETLLQFAHANKANLIMMMPQAHNWLKRLFSEGHTQQVARLTDLPLLAIV